MQFGIQCTNGASDSLISEMNFESVPDPRSNSSLYDIKLTGFLADSAFASISDILFRKSNMSGYISKYKLIYYSPQLLPSSLFGADDHLSKNLIEINSDALFTIDMRGYIHLNVSTDLPLLEYLCMRKAYCSCFSCIFTLNFIYSTPNKINSDTVRVFIDDLNQDAPVFYFIF